MTVSQESTDVSVEMGRKEVHFAKCAGEWCFFKGDRGTGFRELHSGVCPRFGLGEPIAAAPTKACAVPTCLERSSKELAKLVDPEKSAN